MGAALPPASFAKASAYWELGIQQWQENSKERQRGEKEAWMGKGALIPVWRAVLLLEKPGASLMPNPGAVGLGKAKDVIRKSLCLPCCV